MRHILDMFICLDRGMAEGTVNYERRSRDHRMETDPEVSMMAIDNIIAGLSRADVPLMLEGQYHVADGPLIRVRTSYQREVLYNLEHAIHHMAMIRIGIEVLGVQTLPDGFGVAPSTTKHKSSCAQ